MMKETFKILSFETAMVMQNEREKYDRTKWIYVPDFYTEYRYILGTVGNNPLITIGINPSTAEPEKMDNTMKSVERIAKGNGFDSFIMFNVYAQRATDPNQMNKEIDPVLHKENMEAFQWILENSGKKPVIWAAWGTNIERRTYLKKCLREMINISNASCQRDVETGAYMCIVCGSIGKMTRAQIMEKSPDISHVTVERALKDMFKKDKILKIGGGRDTAYIWNKENK